MRKLSVDYREKMKRTDYIDGNKNISRKNTSLGFSEYWKYRERRKQRQKKKVTILVLGEKGSGKTSFIKTILPGVYSKPMKMVQYQHYQEYSVSISETCEYRFLEFKGLN